MQRAKPSFLALPMTPEEDRVLREIYQRHQFGKSATVDDLHQRLAPQGLGKFEIRLCLGSLRDDGYLIELNGSGVYSLTGDGLHHVRFVKPIEDSPTSVMLRAALIAGVLVWMVEALTGIKAFGDAGSLIVALSVATSLTLTLYRRYRGA
jgi:hypothetical protein